MDYPSHLHISYSNDEEYKLCLHDFFLETFTLYRNNHTLKATMSTNILNDLTSTSSSVLDFVFEITHKNPNFINLYEKSAAICFSTDLDIGLAILFSYSYFDLFHKCLSLFIKQNNEPDFNNNEYFNTLINMFKK